MQIMLIFWSVRLDDFQINKANKAIRHEIKNFKKSNLLVNQIEMLKNCTLKSDDHTNNATTKPWVGRCEAKYDKAHNIEAKFTVRWGLTGH